MRHNQAEQAVQTDSSLSGKRRLRDSVIARISLAVAIVGVLLLMTGLAYPENIRPVRGIELLCIAYLLLLVSMYQIGNPVTTRGGIVIKLESPWTYRFCFVPFSVIGTGPIFVLLSGDVFAGPPCTSILMYLDASVVLLAGLFALLGVAIIWGFLVIGTILGIFRFLQKALSPKG